jgi:hypothetical protein
MGFIPIRVHMTQGCVSVGKIPIKPEVKENASQALFSFIPSYPPSITRKNKIYMRWQGVHFKKQNGRQRGILLFRTPTTQWRKEYNGNIRSNHTENNQRKS